MTHEEFTSSLSLLEKVDTTKPDPEKIQIFLKDMEQKLEQEKPESVQLFRARIGILREALNDSSGLPHYEGLSIVFTVLDHVAELCKDIKDFVEEQNTLLIKLSKDQFLAPPALEKN